MNFKLPFILLVIGVGVAGVIPFGISQIVEPEPAMEIDMIAGQEQFPFRIQDHNDLNVFAIGTNGQQLAGYYEEFKIETELGEEITLTDCGFQDYGWVANATLGNDCILAEFEVNVLDEVKAGSGYFVPIHQGLAWADMKRDAGAGNCQTDMLTNTIGDDFYGSEPYWGSLIITSPTYTDDIDFTGTVDSMSDVLSFRIIFDTGNTGTTCTFKNISYYLEIPNFNWYTIKEIKNGL